MKSLQENLGRKDLDWLEIARGYQALQEEGLTHEQVASLVGVSRVVVTNRLSLIRLPEEVKNVPRRTFSEGHAKLLLELDTPEEQLEAFSVWKNSPVTSKSFQKIVKRVKSGLHVRGEVKKAPRGAFCPKLPLSKIPSPLGERGRVRGKVKMLHVEHFLRILRSRRRSGVCLEAHFALH